MVNRGPGAMMAIRRVRRGLPVQIRGSEGKCWVGRTLSVEVGENVEYQVSAVADKFSAHVAMGAF